MNVYCNVIHNVFCAFLGVHKITLLQRQSQRSFHVSSTLIQRCDNVILLAGNTAPAAISLASTASLKGCLKSGADKTGAL